MKRDNRGLTFIELIIVVAIMSILVGVAGYGINMVSGKAADECAQKIIVTLEQARTKALGKYSVTYEIKKNLSTGLIEVKESVIAKMGDSPVETVSTVGNKDVSVVCHYSDGTSKTVSSANSFVLNFDRVTGGFKPEVVGEPDCNKIEVSKAHKTRNIILIPPTGKVYAE